MKEKMSRAREGLNNQEERDVIVSTEKKFQTYLEFKSSIAPKNEKFWSYFFF